MHSNHAPHASLSGTVLLQNARLPGTDTLVDLEVRDGYIRRLGADARSLSANPVAKSASAELPAVDLHGRWVIPGLWDNHVHFSQWAQTRQRLDLASTESAAEVLSRVAAHVPRLASGESMTGFGFRDGLWPEAPTLAGLDAVSGTVPVVLISADLHSCWLNTAALRLHGLLHTQNVGESLAGVASGLIREDDCFAVVAALAPDSNEELDRLVDEAGRAAAARGIVGIVDLEMEWGFEHWRRRIGAGSLNLRVDVGIYTANLQRAIDQGLRTGMTIPGTEELLRVGPYKVITDGALNTRTAWCVDEYPGLHGRPDSHGLLTVAPEDLLGYLRTALEAGLRPAVHAIGDQANHLALNAFEQLQSLRGSEGTGRQKSMGSIEHAQLLTLGDMARFASLGVVASVQPEHAMDDRDVADRYWAGRTDRAFALNSLLNAGAELALGSDAPVAPLDPWFSLAAAVGRSRDDRESWHPAESITVRQALTASARGRSALRLNDIADIAVCDEDPYEATVSQLRHMPVSATLIAGRFTHNELENPRSSGA